MTETKPDSTSRVDVKGSAEKDNRVPATPPYCRTDVTDALADLMQKIGAHSTDLPPAEWQLLDIPFKEKFPQLFVSNMLTVFKVLIGFLWLPLVGIGSLAGLLWSYPLAERAQAGNGTTVAVQWIGPDFHATPTTAVLLAMAFAASAGSVVQAAIVFAMRAGNQTLERGYEAWYYLRPVTSLLLGPLFGLATIGGLSAITSGSGASAQLSLPALVTAGALAGLFTDRVLQQMQHILGATDPDKHASQQDTPWTPNASTATTGKTGAAGSSAPSGGTAEADQDKRAAEQSAEQPHGDGGSIVLSQAGATPAVGVEDTHASTPRSGRRSNRPWRRSRESATPRGRRGREGASGGGRQA